MLLLAKSAKPVENLFLTSIGWNWNYSPIQYKLQRLQ